MGGLLVGCLVAFSAPSLAAAGPAFPFGSHKQPYERGVLSPSVRQSKLDEETSSFYDGWKKRYLRAGCEKGQYYVVADTDAGSYIVSEGIGYGMLISALMAGYDPAAQKIFDGLLRYYLAHPSGIDDALLSASQNKNCKNIDGNDSATDGDLDGAYALLIADKQWGSDGEFDYLAAAERIAAGIYRSNVNPKTLLVNLGDWVTVSGKKYRYATRSSDWMVGHFRAFAAFKPAQWTPVLDAHLKLIAKMQKEFSDGTGLLPDFVVNGDSDPQPAPPNFLEAKTDGKYSYNACRDPWRLGIDAATSGDQRSLAAARKLSRWIRGAANGKPNRIRDGYALNGAPLVHYNTMSFAAPFAVAAMVDPGAQDWLDALWDTIVDAKPDGYYPDSLKLLSMLSVSRNWLTP